MIRIFLKNLLCFLLVALQLAAAAEPTPPLTEPIPSVTVHIPMRDGFELTADLYYPTGSIVTNEYPCILIRLPGGRKAKQWLPLAKMAQDGYVVAIQDTRSALDPEGATLPYFSDGWGVHQDGLDTINWLASSSFTNGEIGTAGFSAAGVTQLMLAPTAPPALKCQYIGQAFGSLFHHAIFQGGQFQKNMVEVWLSHYAPHPSVLEFVVGQPIYNNFWQSFNTMNLAHQVEVPAVHYGGWYDPFIQGTIDAFIARQGSSEGGARKTQKLLIGPWTHFWPKDLTLGDFQVPLNGQSPPLDISPKRWFDYYLKGIKNGASDIAAVTYYVMGPLDGTASSGNVWRHADAWPVPAEDTTFFLTADKKITTTLPAEKKNLSYVNNPDDPVPTIGGRNLFLLSGPRDQRPNEARKDVLVFTSAPLEEELEVTGQMFAKFFFSSSVPDTDVAAWLTDVYPDGKSLLVAEGLTRTGRLQGSDVSADIPQELTIDLLSTSTVFAKGHSIRVVIAGSNYPRYEKNQHGAVSGNDETIVVANCRIYVGNNTPSRLILPVIRKSAP
ncbi:MAG: CocE/NonD family hydrolase [Parachlamydiaceae bacterium]